MDLDVKGALLREPGLVEKTLKNWRKTPETEDKTGAGRWTAFSAGWRNSFSDGLKAL